MNKPFYFTNNTELAQKLTTLGYKIIEHKNNTYVIFDNDKQGFSKLQQHLSDTEIKQLVATNKFYL